MCVVLKLYSNTIIQTPFNIIQYDNGKDTTINIAFPTSCM